MLQIKIIKLAKPCLLPQCRYELQDYTRVRTHWNTRDSTQAPSFTARDSAK